MQESLLKACEGSTDEVTVNFMARIKFAGDIRTVKAKHRQCMQKFKLGPKSANMHQNPGNFNELNGEAFKKLCSWLESSERKETQYSLADLREHLSSLLPVHVPAYSGKHIKRGLLQHFGSRLTVSELQGSANVITLHEKASSMLHDTYHEQQDECEDKDILNVKQTGEMIGNIRKQNNPASDFYPAARDIDLEQLQLLIPETL